MLLFRFLVPLVLDVVASQDIGIQTDRGISRVAGSKSAGTAGRWLLNIPKPLVGCLIPVAARAGGKEPTTGDRFFCGSLALEETCQPRII